MLGEGEVACVSTLPSLLQTEGLSGTLERVLAEHFVGEGTGSGGCPVWWGSGLPRFTCGALMGLG